MRSEQERRDHAEQVTNQKTTKHLQESKDFAVNSLASISLTELQRLKDDNQYQEDFTMTSSHFVKMVKKVDQIEDEALKLATENVKLTEDLEGDLQVYQETVHPLYEEQCEKANQLVGQFEAKQQVYSRANAVKILKAKANEKYKEGRKAQQNYNKGGGTKEEFLEQFINSRKEYYQLAAYQEIVLYSSEVG